MVKFEGSFRVTARRNSNVREIDLTLQLNRSREVICARWRGTEVRGANMISRVSQ